MAADGGLMLGAALVGGLLAGGLAWWLGQRQIKEAADRVTHLEQARHQAVQHTTMARRQIEQLQKELGCWRRAAPSAGPHRHAGAAAAGAAGRSGPAA